MTATYLQITGLDPIVARDGRPFGDGTGNRMRGLPWPLPSAVAGSARRAFVIQQESVGFDPETINQLLQIEVAGLFPIVERSLYLPAPKNCVWRWDKKENIDHVYRSVPRQLQDGDGCDLTNGLWPVMLENPPADDFKPEPLPAWWPVDELARWLTGETINSGKSRFGNGCFLAAGHSELRERVCIEPATGAAEESKLFAVSDLTISHLRPFRTGDQEATARPCQITLSCRVTDTDLTRSLNLYHPLGGNRRLAHWKTAPQFAGLWTCPQKVRDRLKGAKRVCLLLATPALFKNGHLPGWLKENIGSPPGTIDVQLKLFGVLNERWKALARFALDPQNRGARPLRRMVPAGSMYFFEVQQGDAALLADLWLQSVSDGEQERRDGFGLAVWGIW